MSIDEQIESMKATLTTLKEVLPRVTGEDFLTWMKRGLDAGLLTVDEHEVLNRIFVYGSEHCKRFCGSRRPCCGALC